MSSPADRDYLDKALDITIRLGAIAIIVLGSLWIFSPFAMVVLWAIVLAITFGPLCKKMQQMLGGSAKLAGTLFVVVCLAAVIVPVGLLTKSVLHAAGEARRSAEAGTLVIPAPTDSVRDWPVIGEKVYALWQSAAVDLEGTARELRPQIHSLASRLASAVSGIGAALVQTVLAIVIAGILMATSAGRGQTVRAIALRLGGERGPAMVDLSVGTIRSVVKGVVLVALIQGLLAAGGLAIADVPGVGVWALLVTILAVMQLPPILVLGPIIPWVFANNDSTLVAIFYTVWSLIVSFSDPFLKMLLLGRGVGVPMPVILIGAIGGLLQSGMVGLFVGPVILAIFYQVFTAWVGEVDGRSAAKPEPDTARQAGLPERSGLSRPD